MGTPLPLLSRLALNMVVHASRFFLSTLTGSISRTLPWSRIIKVLVENRLLHKAGMVIWPVTLLTWSTVTVHVPVPLQTPPQPIKLESSYGVEAVRVTTVPDVYCPVTPGQSQPQNIADLSSSTSPLPVPNLVSV